MGQTLTNGIYLPNEGERNCYSGLAANWNAVDTLKGNYSLHAINVDIHVTAAEKETWNGKADNSALTAHTGNTTIHVTAADKQAWDGHVADTTIHVTSADKQAWNGHVADTVKHVTAEDKAKWDAVTSKADDSAVVHNTGNETIDGNKSLLKNLKIKNKDVTRGSTTGSSSRSITFTDVGDNTLAIFSVGKVSNGSTAIGFRVDTTDNNDVNINSQFQFFISKSGAKVIIPSVDGDIALGRSSNRWSDVQTYKVNALEPSSLSLPNYSGSKIDISSYITNLTGGNNTYLAPANGYIFVRTNNGTYINLVEYLSGACSSVCSQTADDIGTFIPVNANRACIILIKCSSVNRAYFIPCQGNV